MYTIRVRRKHKLFICFLFMCLFVLCYLFNRTLSTQWMRRMLGDLPAGTCTNRIRWSPKPQPVIAVIGQRGSGVVLARFLIEQMTGIYTGSVSEEYSEYFDAQGITKKVIAVMMNNLNEMKGVQGAILVFRNMKDVIRTQFAMDQGRGAFLEAPMAAYYGKTWHNYVDAKSKEWAKSYRTVLDSGLPVLIVGYEELLDPVQLRPQLLKISNYLHVPIKNSVLDCIIEKTGEFEGRPRALRQGFQPFSLLPVVKARRYDKVAWDIQMLVRLRRDKYMPKVR